MSVGRTFTIRHWTETFVAEVEPRVALDAAARAESERVLATLLFDFRNRDRDVTHGLEAVHRALFAPAARVAPPGVDTPATAREIERIARELEGAARSGRLALVTKQRPRNVVPKRVEGPAAVSALGPAPEADPTFFQAIFVDEIGEPISGLDVVLTAEGKPHQLKTDGSGKVRLDDVRASFANVRVSSVKSLRDIVEPRWTKVRTGKMPTTAGLVKLPLTDDLDSLSLESATPQLIVIVPPLGKIFVELLDRSGRVRHANREYTIEGPANFSGTTDADGRLLHDEVLPGDYTLKFKLKFFEGTKDEVTDDYESALVIVDAAEGTPQQRRIGAVPFVVFARARGFLFDTNKTFLLPTAVDALQSMRDLYEQNDPSHLLIVGHTDTTAEPSINDPLSVARAKSVKAYLEDDVDTWLKNYDGSGKGKWGSREDRLMVTAMPDFGLRTADEGLIEWFQRTRALTVDGKAGPETRKQLVTEYMALDGTSLKDDEQFQIDITTHGSGENFPLDSTGLALDTAAANDQEDPLDRRAELFFFDDDFGILPAPAAANGKEYLAWRKAAAENHDFPIEGIGRKATVIEVHDALFRTNSCVVLPEGEAPSPDEHGSLTSVGIFATVLRFNEEHPGKKHFIAGHTDTTNTVDFNQKLSEERANCALALLMGDRDTFASLADKRHTVGDYKQMLSFATKSFADLSVGSGGFDCDPGKVDDVEFTGIEPVKKFQAQYNQNKAAMGAAGPDLTVDGSVGPQTWGGLFDMLEFALQRELGEPPANVAALRSKIVFVDDSRKALGFSELQPVDKIGRDGVLSQANRRVEIMQFDVGEEPDLVLAESDPDVSELYLPGEYEHATLDPMVSALPWVATWDAPTADASTPRIMQLNAPGLPSGTPLVVTLSLNDEPLRVFNVAGGAGNASLPYTDWEVPDEVPDLPILEAGLPFPPAVYTFGMEGGGRLIQSRGQTKYADRVHVQLVVDPNDGDPVVILKNEPYVLCTPWGQRKGTTDANGVLDETGVPPGSAGIVIRDHQLINLGTLPHNWDASP